MTDKWTGSGCRVRRGYNPGPGAKTENSNASWGQAGPPLSEANTSVGVKHLVCTIYIYMICGQNVGNHDSAPATYGQAGMAWG